MQQLGWSTLSDLQNTQCINSFSKIPLAGNYFAITGLFCYIKIKVPTDYQLERMTSDYYGALNHRAFWKSYQQQHGDYAAHPVILPFDNNKETHNGTLYFSDDDKEEEASNDNATI